MADPRTCACGNEIVRTGSRGRWPERCAECREQRNKDRWAEKNSQPEQVEARRRNAARWRKENPDRHARYQRNWRRVKSREP